MSDSPYYSNTPAYAGSPQQLEKEVHGLIDQGLFLATDLPGCLRPAFMSYMAGKTFVGSPGEPVRVHGDDLYNFWHLVTFRDGLPNPIRFATTDPISVKKGPTDSERLDHAITTLSRSFTNGDGGDFIDVAAQYLDQVLDAARKYQNLM